MAASKPTILRLPIQKKRYNRLIEYNYLRYKFNIMDKLILNWHRIFNMNQLFEFFSKKFKSEIKSESEIENILKNYKGLNIAVWHADTFLKDETTTEHDEIINLLEKYGTVKQTWKIKSK